MDKGKDSFKFVAHSIGAAYGEGIAEYLKNEGWNVETIVHINPAQANSIDTIDPNSNETQTIDYQNTDDWVINLPPFLGDPGDIGGADSKIREESGDTNWRALEVYLAQMQDEKFLRRLEVSKAARLVQWTLIND